jgi:hypothetical protein
LAKPGNALARHVATDHPLSQPWLISLIEQPIVFGERVAAFHHKLL